jgi:hypothetical protein
LYLGILQIKRGYRHLGLGIMGWSSHGQRKLLHAVRGLDEFRDIDQLLAPQSANQFRNCEFTGEDSGGLTRSRVAINSSGELIPLVKPAIMNRQSPLLRSCQDPLDESGILISCRHLICLGSTMIRWTRRTVNSPLISVARPIPRSFNQCLTVNKTNEKCRNGHV